jgi:hypothetical protein
MDLNEQLTVIDEAYYTLEEDDLEGREQIYSVMRELHNSLLEDPEQAENLYDFIVEGSSKAGGIYIPYFFWVELSKLLSNEPDRDLIWELLKRFIESDFEDETLRNMKPLLVVYFSRESEFELDRLKTHLTKAHPKVREYFHSLFRFKEQNLKSVEAYNRKFEIVRQYYPNFELLSLPVQKLEEMAE